MILGNDMEGQLRSRATSYGYKGVLDWPRLGCTGRLPELGGHALGLEEAVAVVVVVGRGLRIQLARGAHQRVLHRVDPRGPGALEVRVLLEDERKAGRNEHGGRRSARHERRLAVEPRNGDVDAGRHDFG